MARVYAVVLVGIVGVGASVLACSGKDKRPPLQDDTPLDDGGASSSSSGHVPTTDAGDGGKTEGGIPGVDGCGTYDPNQVYLRGTTAEGSDGAECWVVSIPYGGKACAALHHSPFYSPVIRPSDGKMLYIETVDTNDKAFGFVPDALVRDGDFLRLPSKPYENDLVLATPTCTRPFRMYAWPDTTGYAFLCQDDRTIRNADGKVLGIKVDGGANAGENIVALGYGGHLLRHRTPSANDVALYIESATGEQTFFTEAALNGVDNDFAWRAKPDGFWVALNDAGVAQASLWHLGFDGKATKMGTYAAKMAGVTGANGAQMDGTGAIYTFGYTETFNDVIVRTPLEPAAAAIVYDEKNVPMGANDFSAANPVIYPKIHISHLVTGP